MAEEKVVNEKVLVTDVSELKVPKEPKEVEISLGGNKIFKIKIREPTWLDKIQAWTELLEMSEEGKPKMNFALYYKRMLSALIVEPKLTEKDIEELSTTVGVELQKLVPPPFEQ